MLSTVASEPSLRWALFDFGDTLVKEPFCRRAPPEVPNWVQHVLRIYDADPIFDRWMLGLATHAQVAEVIAAETPLDGEAVRLWMEAEFRKLDRNEAVWEFARALGVAGRAAIVTINPDAFTTIIEPHYRLDRDYPVRVTSWQEGTADKVELCLVALQQLGDPDGVARAVLIDNRAENVAAFRSIGGAGYLFTTDDAFVRDRATHPVFRRLE